ncbi:hypothetical protein B9Z55_027965 [Caenorhabditis nigoni]|uniref:Protein kinase domain-containing protein n=1 Tax=Caenorhabditis nigoni TaxID=1611254 RepID=A0A2G5SDX8_9PELO|nr:hypothetical protein B9Z55_027965 [Caenorhabditis nigoni]
MNKPRLQLEMNQSIGQYRVVNNEFASGGFGQIFEVRESNGWSRRLLLKTQTIQQFFLQELQMLHIMKNETGFNDLLDWFIIKNDNIDHFCMVIPCQGETFAHVLERSTASPKNAVRIAYRLFTLIEKIHAIGYVHEDLHHQNLLFNMNAGFVQVILIDFGLCESLNPPPKERRMCASWQSIYMCRSARYSVFDDLHSLVFLIMQCVGITPFLTDNKEKFDKKSAFHANPYRYFPNQETTWIADLYTLIENQRESGYHYNSLLDLLDEAIPGVDPSKPIEYQWQNDTFYIA